MRLWRLSRFPTLAGEGGLYASARWHNIGRPILYAATQPPGALVEIMVHLDLDPEEIPEDYFLVGMDVPDPLVASAPAPALTGGWRLDLDETRSVGDNWLASAGSLLLRVPSAIIDQTDNLLINPVHPDMRQVAIGYQKIFAFDARLIR